ncbi:MAG TPA: hypothetical protein VGM72_02680 [Micropepsaceae bacterium]
MKTAKTLMSLLLLSTVSVAPAYANWFSNPRTNTMMNIGSAPNPTPADLRSIGDSTAVALNGNAGSREPVERVAYVAADRSHAVRREQLTRLEGKAVFGAHGVRLGSILTVNLAARMAEVQTPSGIAVAMPVGLLRDRGNHVAAPTISRADMTAMAKTQTGHTIAINIDRRRPSRG